MKILHTVESYFPSTNGMQEVVQQISERLVRLGHDITVATSYHTDRKHNTVHGVHIEQFYISGNAIRGIDGGKEEIQRYINLLLSSQFDVITNFAAQQWATDLTLPILNKIKAKKVFVPTGFSGLFFPQYKKYFIEMKHWMKQYDMNVFLSNDYRDTKFARKNGVKKRVLIPNGASGEEFLSTEHVDIRKKLDVPVGNFLILLVGSHTGAKGHREAIDIFRKANITNVTLLIVAHPSWNRCTRRCFMTKYIFNVSPKRFTDKKQLIITSLSRKETINAYKQANLFLFPSNIECSPIVLFEAMASKTPFLTTDVGNAREIIRWSKSGMLLPTTKNKCGYSTTDVSKSATILEQIFRNAAKRETMAEHGFAVWQKRFTWDTISKQYEQLYQKLLMSNK